MSMYNSRNYIWSYRSLTCYEPLECTYERLTGSARNCSEWYRMNYFYQEHCKAGNLAMQKVNLFLIGKITKKPWLRIYIYLFSYLYCCIYPRPFFLFFNLLDLEELDCYSLSLEFFFIQTMQVKPSCSVYQCCFQ